MRSFGVAQNAQLAAGASRRSVGGDHEERRAHHLARLRLGRVDTHGEHLRPVDERLPLAEVRLARRHEGRRDDAERQNDERPHQSSSLAPTTAIVGKLVMVLRCRKLAE